jgi:hypothetical protein
LDIVELLKKINEFNNFYKLFLTDEQQILLILRRLGECADVNESQMRSLEESGAGVSFNKFDSFEHDLLLSHPKECADEIVKFLITVQ